jgi:hypothetical protein
MYANTIITGIVGMILSLDVFTPLRVSLL